MRNRISVSLFICFSVFLTIYAQDPQLTEKPGTFKILSRTNYTALDCGFTKAPQIVKINPDYWDRSLPKSAIQFIHFRSITNKDYLRGIIKEAKDRGQTSFVRIFEEAFDIDDIRALAPLIGK